MQKVIFVPIHSPVAVPALASRLLRYSTICLPLILAGGTVLAYLIPTLACVYLSKGHPRAFFFPGRGFRHCLKTARIFAILPSSDLGLRLWHDS